MRKLVILAGFLAFAGCDPPPLPAPHVAAIQPRTYHDVEYHMANPVERQQTFKWCADNPSLQDKNPSCNSAVTAHRRAWNRDFYGKYAMDPASADLGLH